MNVLMIRSRVKPDNAAEVEAAVAKTFAAIEQAEPRGVRYASCRLPDGVTYVAILALEDPAANSLLEIPAFTEFQENLKGWLAGPPIVEQLTVAGSYELF
jgi:quinol monooxygenase YgiN